MAEDIKWVEVVDADGEPVPGFDNPVPSHWIGTDLLPAGTKRKRAERRAKDEAPAPSGDTVPAESENRDVLEAYAVAHAGISEEDAKAFPNKAELHAAIVAAKAPPA